MIKQTSNIKSQILGDRYSVTPKCLCIHYTQNNNILLKMADGCHFYPDPRSDKIGKIKYTSNSKSLTLIIISIKCCILNNITSQITKYYIGHCPGRHFESAHRVEIYNFTLFKITSNSNFLGLNTIKTYFEYHRKSINHQKACLFNRLY